LILAITLDSPSPVMPNKKLSTVEEFLGRGRTGVQEENE
jgi:hypothetical protein